MAPPIHPLTPLHSTEEERSQDHCLLPCFLLEEDGEGDHDHTHPFPRKRRAETMATLPPSFLKREAMGIVTPFPFPSRDWRRLFHFPGREGQRS